MESVEVKLKMLTPLWTGGVDGSMDRIHETGIVGSLRWWYEAIVRGLGGRACDPSGHECGSDGMCDVCRMFGTTGWRRRFRLEVVEDETEMVLPSPLNVRPPGRSRGWYLPPGRTGTFTLCLHGGREELSKLASLFLFLERWGNIGAKPQLGYGIFSIINRAQVAELAEGWTVMDLQPPNEDLPDLRRFAFFLYRFEPQKPNWWTRVPGMEGIASKLKAVVSDHRTVPIAPSLKNEWRFNRWKGSRSEAMEVFGTSGGGDESSRLRSRIAVSWAYPSGSAWEVRGWAWLRRSGIAPQVWELLQDEEGWRKVIGIRGTLETYPQGSWRERSAEEIAQFLEETRCSGGS